MFAECRIANWQQCENLFSDYWRYLKNHWRHTGKFGAEINDEHGPINALYIKVKLGLRGCSKDVLNRKLRKVSRNLPPGKIPFLTEHISCEILI
jgi:hypothetical protein